ncbi:MAG TPA: hypothetical protein VKG44_02290, partial [Candidatus Baltobacteraceae bacterium]|nr:hypothetical protein [Candidatus Baltobacteraceae bacterium]
FREIAASPPPATIEPERRELQLLYAAKLGSLLTSTDPAMPEEARALARAELAALESACTRALHSTALDPLTRAHLEWLRTRARDALSAPKH